MKKRNKGVAVLDVTGYYSATIIETVWYWQRKGHRATGRAESPDTDPYK